jgi:hypothetical protein
MLRFCHLLLGERACESESRRPSACRGLFESIRVLPFCCRLVLFSSPRSKRLTVLTRCLTGRPPECAREIRLAGKAEIQCDIHQGQIAPDQQHFRAIKSFGADIAMRRLTHRLLEGPSKMVSAQACNRCDTINGKVAFEICLYVIQHTEEPASIEPFPTWIRLTGRCVDMLLN